MLPRNFKSILASRNSFRKASNNNLNLLANYVTDSKKVPSDSKVVICGGGVIGTSVAYHLAERGITDVTLLEQGSLTCGTTWHAAGLIGRNKAAACGKMADYGRTLYKELEANGHPTGFKECGSISVLRSDEMLKADLQSFEKLRALGIQAEWIPNSKISELSPLINTDRIKGGIWLPEDGSASPTDICNSFSKIAKDKGVKIIEDCEITKVKVRNNGIAGVSTNKGDIDCQYFVLCGGMWSRQFGLSMNPQVSLPSHVSQHFYLITKPIDGVDFMMPVVRDRENYLYIREWSGGLLVGLFEPNALPEFPNGVPSDLRYHLFPENWEHFEKYMEPIMNICPSVANSEVQQLLNGPESFTPDLVFSIGEAPNVKNMYVATNMCSGGVVQGPATGRIIAEMINNEEPFVDPSKFDIKRFAKFENNKQFLWDRMTEILGNHYMVNYPKQMSYETGREARCSYLYHQHKEDGAVFDIVNRIETPMYYNSSKLPLPPPSMSKPNWCDIVGNELSSCYKGCGLVDITHLYSYFSFASPDAEKILDNLSFNKVPTKIGEMSHAWMLNSRGNCAFTCNLLKESDERYLIIVHQSHHGIFFHHMMKNDIYPNGKATITDLTHAYSSLALIGDESENVLKDMTGSDVSKHEFKSLELGYGVDILAFKSNDLPKSGVCLSIPAQYTNTVYQALKKSPNIKSNVGVLAFDTMTVSDAVPQLGKEINVTVNPFQIFNRDTFKIKESDFVGKSCVVNRSIKENKKLMKIVIKDVDKNQGEWFWKSEIIKTGDKIAGFVSCVVYDFKKDRFCGMAFLEDPDEEAEYFIEYCGVKYDVKISPMSI